VIALVVDDGVPNRGHRVNIFKEAYKVLGSWTGIHGKYGSMTTINYAGGMTSNGNTPLTANTAPIVDECNNHSDDMTCKNQNTC